MPLVVLQRKAFLFFRLHRTKAEAWQENWWQEGKGGEMF